MNRKAGIAAQARIGIDLGALAANWRMLAKLAPDATTGAAVKADAYGVGASQVVPALVAAGCNDFFVADPVEGLAARKFAPGARIFVLAGIAPANAGELAANRLVPILNSMRDIETWAAFNRIAGAAHPSAIHADTGMNRLGIETRDMENLAGDAATWKALAPCLLMSHLACSDQPAHPMNGVQLARFRAIAARFPGMALSLASSAGIFLGKEYHFDLTRPGIALYGGEAVNDVANPMRPVVAFEARILQIRHAKKGETVGYGAGETLSRDSMLAVAGAGYADGIARASGGGVAMRKLATGAFGYLGGHRVPVIGRISMDLTTFDVTSVPPGILARTEWIEFFGKNIALDDFARSAGTVGYEVLTGLSRRAERVYVGGAPFQGE